MNQHVHHLVPIHWDADQAHAASAGGIVPCEAAPVYDEPAGDRLHDWNQWKGSRGSRLVEYIAYAAPNKPRYFDFESIIVARLPPVVKGEIKKKFTKINYICPPHRSDAGRDAIYRVRLGYTLPTS